MVSPSLRFSYAERAWAGPDPEQQVVAIDGDFRQSRRVALGPML